jgi:DNA-binding HxlR family transcriptional regulator
MWETKLKELSPSATKAIADLAKAFRIPVDEIGNDPSAARLRELIVHRDGTDFRRDDPVREITARLGDRWSSLLMFALESGTMGHARLRRVICAISAEGKISQRMLTLRLRALERDGLVARKVTPVVPPRVDYSLTPLGQELTDLIRNMVFWIEDHSAEILAARNEFAIREAPSKPLIR